MTTPSVSVVVCIHNALDYVRVCLQSVARHTPTTCRLILINDGSDAATTTWLERYAATRPRVTLLANHPARGYTCAANRGLRASLSDYTVLLNSDTVVSPNWIEGILECGESDPAVGIVGPLSNAATYQSVPDFLDDRGQWKENRLPEGYTVSDYAEFVRWASERIYPRVPVVNGFCFAVKRQVIDAIGYLDEESFPRGYGEENDYCARAADAGFQLAVADQVYVYHAVSRSFGTQRREVLIARAHEALRRKYPQERFDRIDQALRHHPELARVRERIRHTWPEWQQRRRQLQQEGHRARVRCTGPSVLFLLPGCTAYAGGSQAVVELAMGLSRIGFFVRVAIEERFRQEYQTIFPGQESLFLHFSSPRQVIATAGRHDVVVATLFSSVKLLGQMMRAAPLLPAYFVQDYEPWFFEPDSDYYREAERSYTLIPGCLLFALSSWVVREVERRHDVKVRKIEPSFETSTFYPDFRLERPGPVRLCAMVRPATPWRGGKQTMDLFSRLKARYRDSIQLTVFGAGNDEIQSAGIAGDFEYRLAGRLDKTQLADLFRGHDIFLDLSRFQAFGRTVLEAMACGCAVVAPREGGVGDYGVDGENLLLVDTSDPAACEQAVVSLIDKPALRRRLGCRAAATASTYSSHRSAISFALLLSDELNRCR